MKVQSAFTVSWTYLPPTTASLLPDPINISNQSSIPHSRAHDQVCSLAKDGSITSQMSVKTEISSRVVRWHGWKRKRVVGLFSTIGNYTLSCMCESLLPASSNGWLICFKYVYETGNGATCRLGCADHWPSFCSPHQEYL